MNALLGWLCVALFAIAVLAVYHLRQVAAQRDALLERYNWLQQCFVGNEHWLQHEFPHVAAYAHEVEQVLIAGAGFDIAWFRDKLRRQHRS